MLPNGTDDTANLQCAIDYGRDLGPGTVVLLAEGVFKTAQLVVKDFDGTIRGASTALTRLQNLDAPLPAASPDFWRAQPSAANRYPVLISILGEDVRLSDLSIALVGADVIPPWSVPGTGLIGWTALHSIIGITESNMRVRAERLDVAGTGCKPFGGNVLAGMIAWKWSQQPLLSSVRVEVADSTFAGSCTGVTAAQVADSAFVVTATTFRDSVLYGFNFADVKASWFEARRNLFEAFAGIYVWPGDLGIGVADSSIVAVKNEFRGAFGFLSDTSWSPIPGAPLFVGDMHCLFVGNDIEAVSGLGYMFAETTYGCRVVGRVGGSVGGDLSGHVIHDVPVKGGLGQEQR